LAAGHGRSTPVDIHRVTETNVTIGGHEYSRPVVSDEFGAAFVTEWLKVWGRSSAAGFREVAPDHPNTAAIETVLARWRAEDA
jgi:hypothetical protein